MRDIRLFVVQPTECQLVENVLNKFRIGLNDWDRTKIFSNVRGHRDVVIYMVLCDEQTHESIKTIIRESRLRES
jgi:hypothetical protein